MENITTLAQLKATIAILESEQEECEKKITGQLLTSYTSFMIINTLENIFEEFIRPANSKNKLISIGLSIASRYALKKLIVKMY